MTVQSDANHQASAMHPLAFLLGSPPCTFLTRFFEGTPLAAHSEA
jgi:hypothetical protein